MKKPQIHQVHFEQVFYVCSDEKIKDAFKSSDVDMNLFGIGILAKTEAPEEFGGYFEDGYNEKRYLHTVSVSATKPFSIESSWELQEEFAELLPKRARKAWHRICDNAYNYGGNEKQYVHEVIEQYGLDEFTERLMKKGYDCFCWVDNFRTEPEQMTVLVFDEKNVHIAPQA